MTDEINEKKNVNIKFKLKKKKLINFKIMTMTNEKKIIMKKNVSIKNDDFQMFKIFNVKNSIKRVSTKFVINDTTLFSNIFKISSFNFEKFLK